MSKVCTVSGMETGAKDIDGPSGTMYTVHGSEQP